MNRNPDTAHNPLTRYRLDVAEHGFRHDAAQEAVARQFAALQSQLSNAASPSLLDRLRGRTAYVQGIYLHGGVGRGKTYLMDLFYETLGQAAPKVGATRRHFHRFMQDVHAQLKSLSGRADPLQLVADHWSEDIRVLCLDEFAVSDIGDAMILGTLLTALFERGVTLITTSNVAPDDLYASGLQRVKFLPAIEAIKQHCSVVPLDTDEDYRLRILEQAEIYHHPLDEIADIGLEQYFEEIAPGRSRKDVEVDILGRPIRARRIADSVVWFTADALIDGPRSAADYIEIARSFATVLISGVPQFTADDENEARRFVHLIDEFYDRRVKLILSAATPPTELYQGKRLHLEFERTVSRLIEMQSTEYLARQHVA